MYFLSSEKISFTYLFVVLIQKSTFYVFIFERKMLFFNNNNNFRLQTFYDRKRVPSVADTTKDVVWIYLVACIIKINIGCLERFTAFFFSFLALGALAGQLITHSAFLTNVLKLILT